MCRRLNVSGYLWIEVSQFKCTLCGRAFFLLKTYKRIQTSLWISILSSLWICRCSCITILKFTEIVKKRMPSWNSLLNKKENITQHTQPRWSQGLESSILLQWQYTHTETATHALLYPVIPPVYLVISSFLLADLRLGTPLLTPTHHVINACTHFRKIMHLSPGT